MKQNLIYDLKLKLEFGWIVAVFLLQLISTHINFGKEKNKNDSIFITLKLDTSLTLSQKLQQI